MNKNATSPLDLRLPGIVIILLTGFCLWGRSDDLIEAIRQIGTERNVWLVSASSLCFIGSGIWVSLVGRRLIYSEVRIRKLLDFAAWLSLLGAPLLLILIVKQFVRLDGAAYRISDNLSEIIYAGCALGMATILYWRWRKDNLTDKEGA